MFSAFFGHYLLNEKIITNQQLQKALDLQDKVRLKLGTLAINSGYMTVPQVEEVHMIQLTTDKLFGELAIEEGYLSEEQLTELLSSQKPRHLLLAQALVDMDVLTHDEFQKHLNAYKASFELTDEHLKQMCDCDAEGLVERLIDFGEDEHGDFLKDYVSLFLKNQVRFIDSHVRIGVVTRIKKNSYEHLIRQNLHAKSRFLTALAGDEKSLTAFAGLYANEKFRAFGEYPIDAIGEYMNQNNGLFIVNKTNEGLDIAMDIQSHLESPTIKPYDNRVYDIPLVCKSGEIHLVVGKL